MANVWLNGNSHTVALDEVNIDGVILNNETGLTVRFEDRNGLPLSDAYALAYVPASDGDYEVIVPALDFGERRIYVRYSGILSGGDEVDIREAVTARDRVEL